MSLPAHNGVMRANGRRRPNVALLIETSNAYARGLLRGIRAYIHEHRSWSIYVGEQRRGEPAPLWLKRWHGDGIIARIESEAIAEAVVSSGLPAIDVSAARYVPELLFVETDDAAIARLAAERGMSETDVRERAAAQASDEDRERVAHFVIRNDGSQEELAQQVDALWNDLTRRAHPA